jgi:hypothetical protein
LIADWHSGLYYVAAFAAADTRVSYWIHLRAVARNTFFRRAEFPRLSQNVNVFFRKDVQTRYGSRNRP